MYDGCGSLTGVYRLEVRKVGFAAREVDGIRLRGRNSDVQFCFGAGEHAGVGCGTLSAVVTTLPYGRGSVRLIVKSL